MHITVFDPWLCDPLSVEGGRVLGLGRVSACYFPSLDPGFDATAYERFGAMAPARQAPDWTNGGAKS
jgi:hypothetical protein